MIPGCIQDDSGGHPDTIQSDTVFGETTPHKKPFIKMKGLTYL
jgi:hypothetical protein